MSRDNDLVVADLLVQRLKAAEHYQQGSYSRRQQNMIPSDQALALCQQIQAENRTLFARWRCQHCIQRGVDGIPAQLIASRPGYCDCVRVNQRFLATA